MKILKNIRDAKPAVDASYFNPGEYVAEIIRVKQEDTKMGKEIVVFECRIVAVLDDAEGKSNKADDEVSYMLQVGKFPEMFLRELKAAMIGCGIAEEEIDDAKCEWIWSESQPLSGLLVHTKVRGTLLKQIEGKPQRMYSIVRFQHPVDAAYARDVLEHGDLAQALAQSEAEAETAAKATPPAKVAPTPAPAAPATAIAGLRKPAFSLRGKG